MQKDRDSIMHKILSRINKLYQDSKKLDFSNPRVILLCIAVVILPFVAWYYVSSGFILGLFLSISILWLVEKSPDFIKELITEYPLYADLILSTVAVVMIGGYFGSGLVLGFGAVFATVILSWALTAFAERYKKEKATQPPEPV